MEAGEELYHRLIEPVEERMMAVVARIVRDPDDAADALQEVLATIWGKLERIDRHPNPHAYIMRICVTRSYDALRKRARLRRREVPLERDVAQSAEASSEPDGERRTQVRRAVACLPPRQGRALLLRVMDEETYGAIGRILGCSEATARSHVSKGAARLRRLLAEQGVKA